MPHVITVSVEQKHINKAREHRAYREWWLNLPDRHNYTPPPTYDAVRDCPIALAIHEQHPNSLIVFVRGITLATDHSFELGKLPKEAQDFIRDFDQYREVQPFVFMVEICAP